MRVIVAGSRKLGKIPKRPKPTPEEADIYADIRRFCIGRILELKNQWKDQYGAITTVISGCADGVDDIAIELAGRLTGHSAMKFPAKWNDKGVQNKRAGLERNELMAKHADGAIILCLPGSRGSLHMAKLCHTAKIPYILEILEYDDLEMYVPGSKELLLRG